MTAKIGNTLNGHEVIIWSQVPNVQVNHNALEYGWLSWSADGKRMAWYMDLTTAAYSTRYGYPWFSPIGMSLLTYF